MQGVQIAEHCHRLFKGSHQIFAAGQVDRSFSAYGRIHLCQQAGGDLEIIQTAEIGRRRESGNISYHAAAQCNQTVGAGDIIFTEEVVDLVQRFAALGGFSVWEHELDRPEAVFFQRLGHNVPVIAVYMVIGNDSGSLCLGLLLQICATLSQQSSPDPNGIRLAGVHGNCFHGIFLPLEPKACSASDVFRRVAGSESVHIFE